MTLPPIEIQFIFQGPAMQRHQTIRLRWYQATDAARLLDLFRDTIRRVNARDYSPEQVDAWAPEDIDPILWASRFEGRSTVVAEQGERLVGFAELERDGHIDRVYVSADHQRQRIGQRLLAKLVAEAERLRLPRLWVEASITARPFFESQSFHVIARQTVLCRGVELTNYRMQRFLLGQGGDRPAVPAPSPHEVHSREADRPDE